MIETFLEWNVEWGRLTIIVCWMKMMDWDIFEVTCLNEALLKDGKWHIVYGTVVNDAQLVNESELYWCDMLNDTRRMNAMNLNDVNLNDVNLNDVNLNDFTNIGMI